MAFYVLGTVLSTGDEGVDKDKNISCSYGGCDGGRGESQHEVNNMSGGDKYCY